MQHLILDIPAGRILPQLITHGMFPAAFESDGQMGSIFVCYHTLITHYIYYMGYEIAIEGGSFLFAWLINLGFNLGKIENVLP